MRFECTFIPEAYLRMTFDFNTVHMVSLTHLYTWGWWWGEANITETKSDTKRDELKSVHKMYVFTSQQTQIGCLGVAWSVAIIRKRSMTLIFAMRNWYLKILVCFKSSCCNLFDWWHCIYFELNKMSGEVPKPVVSISWLQSRTFFIIPK